MLINPIPDELRTAYRASMTAYRQTCKQLDQVETSLHKLDIPKKPRRSAALKASPVPVWYINQPDPILSGTQGARAAFVTVLKETAKKKRGAA